MAYTTINKPNEHFAVNAYTGQNGSRDVTDTDNVNFTPDLVWIKHRDDVASHAIFDSVRGVGKWLESDTTDVEATEAQSLTAFVDGGFSVGTQPNSPRTDESGGTPNHVAWMWRAGGTASSNTDGSITSSVSANTSNGFSIVTWTGDGSKSATVGHGLGSELACIIIRERDGGDWWHNWQKGLSSNSHNVFLNNTEGERSAYSDGHVKKLDNTTTFGFDSSTSNVNAVNHSGINNVAYCFAEIKGYSKFGSYTGNGNADGPFIYTGFKPSFVMIKKYSGTGHWMMMDNARNTFNEIGERLKANATDAGADASYQDHLSNGFKIRTNADSWNGSGANYIYMAFAEAPLVGTNNIPATAR